MAWQQSCNPAVNLSWFIADIQDRSQKKHVDVDRPCVVGAYNEHGWHWPVRHDVYKGISVKWNPGDGTYIFSIIPLQWWWQAKSLVPSLEAKSLRNNKPLQMKEFQIQAAASLMCQGKVPRDRPSLQTPPPAKKKALEVIFGNPASKLPTRIDRWLLRLQQYVFVLRTNVQVKTHLRAVKTSFI
jgi:hypothetical protein